MYWIVTHSRVVYGVTVETSKAIFSRLYESYKLFNDDSKFQLIFQYLSYTITLVLTVVLTESVLIFNSKINLVNKSVKLYNYINKSFIIIGQGYRI